MTDFTLLHNPQASGPAHTPIYLHRGKVHAVSKAAGLVYTEDGVQYTAVSTYPCLP